MPRTITLLFLLLSSGALFGQNVIQVAAGQNTILDAMAGAQTGDVIELTSDGGEYWNDDEIRITFPVTIRAAAGLQNRPILMNNSNETTKDIVRLYDDCTLIGLEFDGNAGVDTLAVKYAIRTSATGAEVKPNYVFKVFDCYFHDIVIGSDGNAFRAYSHTLADTILFENCIVANTGKEAIRVRDEDSDRPDIGFFNVNYFEVSNSTFANTIHDAISVYGGDVEPNTPGPKVRINHVTMHRCGHYGINLKYVDDAEVKNSIITDNLDVVEGTGKTQGGPRLADLASISHCDTLNIGGDWTASNPTATSIFALDPMFADPENLDFTFLNSALAVLADDGGPLGDLRWVDSATSVENQDPQRQTPDRFWLDQNYPNPFNPATTIRYEIAGRSHVRLQIFNLKGELIQTLVNENQDAGEHKVVWEASGLPSGVYFFKLVAGANVITKEMTLLR